MSVKSERVYWIECERWHSELELTDSESTSAKGATERAEHNGWRQVDLGVWLCPRHATEETP